MDADVVTKILEAADQLLATQESWVQGKNVLAGSPARYCLFGAVAAAARGHSETAENEAQYTLLVLANKGSKGGGFGISVTDWNDLPARTFADVKALLKFAIAERRVRPDQFRPQGLHAHVSVRQSSDAPI